MPVRVIAGATQSGTLVPLFGRQTLGQLFSVGVHREQGSVAALAVDLRTEDLQNTGILPVEFVMEEVADAAVVSLAIIFGHGVEKLIDGGQQCRLVSLKLGFPQPFARHVFRPEGLGFAGRRIGHRIAILMDVHVQEVRADYRLIIRRDVVFGAGEGLDVSSYQIDAYTDGNTVDEIVGIQVAVGSMAPLHVCTYLERPSLGLVNRAYGLFFKI